MCFTAFIYTDYYAFWSLSLQGKTTCISKVFLLKIYKTLPNNSDELLGHCILRRDFCRFDVCTFSIVAVQMGISSSSSKRAARFIFIFLDPLFSVSIILSAEAESSPPRQVNTQLPESAVYAAAPASTAFSHSLAKCSTSQGLFSGWGLLITINLLQFFVVAFFFVGLAKRGWNMASVTP